VSTKQKIVGVNRESNRMVDSIAGAKLSKDEIRIIAKIVESLRPKQSLRKRAEVNSTLFGDISLKFRYADLVPEDYKRTDGVIKALDSLRKRDANTFSDDVDIVDGWISKAKHYKRNGIVEIIIGKELLPDYVALGDGYTEYMRDTVFKLNSKYSIHFYKLLARNRDYTYFDLHISYLRKYFNLEEGQYRTLKDLKRRIIMPAYEELKAGGDIYFETDFTTKYDPEKNDVGQLKSGRRVTGYRIKIIDRKARAKKATQQEQYIKNFVDSYFDYVGISRKDMITRKNVESYCEKYGTEEVVQKLVKIKGYVKKNAKKKASYTIMALEKEFNRS